MADITKCQDEECSMKKTCYRYTAKASDRQSYFIESPRRKKLTGYDCDYYLEVKDGES